MNVAKKQKREPDPKTDNLLQLGQCGHWLCLGCGTEFEVTLEPKVIGKPSLAAECEPLPVEVCPFCLGPEIERLM
jgi:hypothetical protein